MFKCKHESQKLVVIVKLTHSAVRATTMRRQINMSMKSDHRPQPHHKDTGTTASSVIQATPDSRICTHTQPQERISLRSTHSNESTSLQITAYKISNMQYRYSAACCRWSPSPFHVPRSLETRSDCISGFNFATERFVALCNSL
jgi:hypothetical protein